MLPAGFEPTIPASERPQTHALDRTATGIGTESCWYKLEVRAFWESREKLRVFALLIFLQWARPEYRYAVLWLVHELYVREIVVRFPVGTRRISFS